MTPRRFLRDLTLVLVVAGGTLLAVTRWVAVPWVVKGDSMEPALRDGDRVVVRIALSPRSAPPTGTIVVFSGPRDEMLVKRVARDPLSGSGTIPDAALAPDSPLESTFLVLGDNAPRSEDSRAFGRVPLHRLRGRVVWRYWPPSRWGAIE